MKRSITHAYEGEGVPVSDCKRLRTEQMYTVEKEICVGSKRRRSNSMEQEEKVPAKRRRIEVEQGQVMSGDGLPPSVAAFEHIVSEHLPPLLALGEQIEAEHVGKVESAIGEVMKVVRGSGSCRRPSEESEWDAAFAELMQVSEKLGMDLTGPQSGRKTQPRQNTLMFHYQALNSLLEMCHFPRKKQPYRFAKDTFEGPMMKSLEKLEMTGDHLGDEEKAAHKAFGKALQTLGTKIVEFLEQADFRFGDEGDTDARSRGSPESKEKEAVPASDSESKRESTGFELKMEDAEEFWSDDSQSESSHDDDVTPEEGDKARVKKFGVKAIKIKKELWDGFLIALDEGHEKVVSFLNHLDDDAHEESRFFHVLARAISVSDPEQGRDDNGGGAMLAGPKDKPRWESTAKMLRERFHFVSREASIKLVKGSLHVGYEERYTFLFNRREFEVHSHPSITYVPVSNPKPSDLPMIGLVYRVEFEEIRIEAVCVWIGMYRMEGCLFNDLCVAFAVDSNACNERNFTEVRFRPGFGPFVARCADARWHLCTEAP